MKKLLVGLLGAVALGLVPAAAVEAKAPQVLRLNSSFAPQG